MQEALYDLFGLVAAFLWFNACFGKIERLWKTSIAFFLEGDGNFISFGIWLVNGGTRLANLCEAAFRLSGGANGTIGALSGGRLRTKAKTDVWWRPSERFWKDSTGPFPNAHWNFRVMFGIRAVHGGTDYVKLSEDDFRKKFMQSQRDYRTALGTTERLLGRLGE